MSALSPLLHPRWSAAELPVEAPLEVGEADGLRARLRRALLAPELALFVLSLGVYAYFFQAGGWNQNTRFALTRAVVEQGRFVIDDYVGGSGDYAVFDGHVYCDKAPGLSALAVPVYAAVYPFAGGERPRGRLVHRAAYLATLLLVSLPSALAVALLFHLARRYGTSAPAAAALALAYGFGTLAFPYATLFYAHQLAAGLLLLGFALVTVEAGPVRLGLAGVALGYAIVSEYPVALVAGVILVYAALTVRARVLWLIAGAALPLLALFAYHGAAFGSPFTLPYQGAADGNRHGGLFLGLTPPTLSTLLKVLFSSERGLFYLMPWLALGVAGAAQMTRQRGRRPLGVMLLAIVVLGLAFNSTLGRSAADWRGGAGVGTRYLAPWLPFFVLGLVGFFGPGRRRAPRPLALAVCALLAALSTGRMFLATAVRPELNHVSDPWGEYYLPHWSRGEVALNTTPFHTGQVVHPTQAWNLGQVLGLSGQASFLPLLAFVLAGGAWVVVALQPPGHRRTARAAVPELPVADPSPSAA